MEAIFKAERFEPERRKRSVLANRARTCARAFLCTIGGLVTAALGDLAIEAAIKGGAFGPGYVDRSHQTIVPVAVVAAASLLLALAWARMNARYDDRWFVTVARDAATARLPVSFGATAALGLLASLAMEHVEQVLGGGLPFGGLPLLSPAGCGILALFACGAAIVVVSLGLAMRGVVATFNFVARALHEALIWLLDVLAGARSAANLRFAAERERSARSLTAGRCRADRAPPRRSFATPHIFFGP